MKLCILDNDDLDPAAVPIWGSYATMFERLLRDAGFQGDVEAFSARHAQYPDSFDAYDVVLLTGSRADAFSKEPWVVDLCSRVSALLEQKKRLIGVCFGHQLIAHCLGAKVDRAPHGWCLGRHTYTWHEPQYFEEHTEQVSLLASHPRDHRHEPQSQILGHLAHYGAPPQTGWRHVYSAGQLMASFRSQFKCAFIIKAKGFKTLPT